MTGSLLTVEDGDPQSADSVLVDGVDSHQEEVPDETLLRCFKAAKIALDWNHITSMANLLNQPSLMHLTKLDAFNANLDSLPNSLPDILPNLQILFLSNNAFVEMPGWIGNCHRLEMVAFKSNNMQRIDPQAFQTGSALRWIILTDNVLTEIPDSIGYCTKLQKFMLSGNRLTTLPEQVLVDHCPRLELIRLACNQLEAAPLTLLEGLPNLAWIALSENPFLHHHNNHHQRHQDDLLLESLPILHDLTQDRVEQTGLIIGQGAGGITRRVPYSYKNNNHEAGGWVAVKTAPTTAACTSDGSPHHEQQMAVLAGQLHCPALIRVLGRTGPSISNSNNSNNNNISNNTPSLVMEFVDHFQALADPPSLVSCTRDVYPPHRIPVTLRDAMQVHRIVTQVLQALQQLHAQHNMCHGDLYGHNLLLHETDPTQVRVSDFGAAFCYPDSMKDVFHRIECRALAILIEELLNLIEEVAIASDALSSASDEKKQKEENDSNDQAKARLRELVQRARDPTASNLTTLYEWWTKA